MAGMKTLGDNYEQRACDWLAARGWQLLARNYRCKPGEIDIVAIDAGTLVFVEVRARQRGRYASAAASVDKRKQRRLLQAADHFLQCHRHWRQRPCRFDVVTFEPPQSGADIEPHWIRSAFTA
jgi:putative endonuclease